MNLIDDHGRHAAEEFPRSLRGQQNVERLGRGDQDVGRLAQHSPAIAHRRIAGSYRGANRSEARPVPAGALDQLAQRHFEALANVVAQRLERRDIDDPNLVGELAARGTPDQIVEAKRKGGERLPGAGRGRDEDVAAGPDQRPAAELWLSRVTIASNEPLADERVKRLDHTGPKTVAGTDLVDVPRPRSTPSRTAGRRRTIIE